MKATKENETVETLVCQTPMAQNQFRTGELVIKIALQDEVPAHLVGNPAVEDMKDKQSAGYMTIEAFVRVGDLTEEQLQAKTPQQYMDNGLIAGILEAVKHGLASERGINFKYAVDDAKEKAESAVAAINCHETLDKLSELSLAISEPQGEA